MISLKLFASFLAICHTCLAWVPHQDSTTRTEPSVQQQGAKIGFLGCGTIASAIARGIATQTDVPIASIAVTKRSENKSAQLQQDFPSLVSIHEDNQEILDTSDLVFLCVLPQLTHQVLQGVAFDDSRHNLISLVVRIV
jgi:pyrroline-5-carboxylate reductase